MIDKDMLFEYAKIWKEYNSNPDFIFNDEQRNIVNLINREAEDNEKLKSLLDKLKGSSYNDEIIEQYFSNSLETSDNEYETIAEVYDVDVSKITHKILNNGKEIFYFYDSKLDRMVVLENQKNGVSLVEQLKNIQNENEIYKTADAEKNSENILDDKVSKENCELKMVPIEEVDKHLNEVNGLTIDDYRKLIYLLENYENFDIRYINIENVIGITSDGKIYEVYKDDELQYHIGEPGGVEYTENNRKSSFILNDNIDFDMLPDHIKKNVIMFYENPFLLEKFDKSNRFLWEEYVKIYEKKVKSLEEENERKLNAPKVRKYIKEKETNYGYVNMKVLTLIISIVSIMILFVGMITN